MGWQPFVIAKPVSLHVGQCPHWDLFASAPPAAGSVCHLCGQTPPPKYLHLVQERITFSFHNARALMKMGSHTKYTPRRGPFPLALSHTPWGLCPLHSGLLDPGAAHSSLPMPTAKGRECQVIPGHGLSSSTRPPLFQQPLIRGLQGFAEGPVSRAWGLLVGVVPILGGPPSLSLGPQPCSGGQRLGSASLCSCSSPCIPPWADPGPLPSLLPIHP